MKKLSTLGLSCFLSLAVLGGCLSHNQNNTRFEDRPYALKFRKMDRPRAEKRLFQVLYQVSRQHVASWTAMDEFKERKRLVHRNRNGKAIHFYAPTKGIKGAPAWYMMWFTYRGKPWIRGVQTLTVEKGTGEVKRVSFYNLDYRQMRFCVGTMKSKPKFKRKIRSYARSFNWQRRNGKPDFRCTGKNRHGETRLRFYKHRDLRKFVRVMTAVYPQIKIRNPRTAK